jgi:hypothetical protein
MNAIRQHQGVGQLPANVVANSGSGNAALLIGVGGLFAGGAVGASVGGHDHRVAGVLIGALAGSILAGVVIQLTGIR